MKLQQPVIGIYHIRTVTQLPDYSDIEKKEVNYNHLMLDKY